MALGHSLFTSPAKWEVKKRKKGKEAYSSLCYKHRTATGTHVPYGITQCYLLPGRGGISAFTPDN